MALNNSQASATQISIPKKIIGFPLESSAKKNVFTQKYDEIRRFDGTTYMTKKDIFLPNATRKIAQTTVLPVDTKCRLVVQCAAL